MELFKQFQFGKFNTSVKICAPEEVFLSTSSLPSVFICDTNTAKIASIPDYALIFENGDDTKNMDNLQKILDYAYKKRCYRNSEFYAFGGGVITDITGFAASLYMRGAKAIFVPTTLLCMVDACLGGKTGINFKGKKNLLGTFYPASEIRISVDFLQYLPDVQLLNGLAEVIKSAMIGNKELLTILEKNKADILNRNKKILTEIIKQSLTIKGNIVEDDFRENGVRAYLNLGHTFAHGLESATSFNINHGYAVAWGIDKMLRTGEKLGITKTSYADRIRNILKLYDYNLNIKADTEKIITGMQMDKKRIDNTIRLVLQKQLGETLLHGVEESLLREILENEGDNVTCE